MKPYYEHGGIQIFLGDCREVLPEMPKAELVFADPPYGIGKAEWDDSFPLWWIELATKVSDRIAITPGNWNLLKLPESMPKFIYKWTLSAHLVNGMTMGGFGWGNWIPCVIYQRERILKPQPEYVQGWCKRFAEWCLVRGIGKSDLDCICGTSDMGGWYLGLLPHRCQIPAPHQWEKLKNSLAIPISLEPEWIERESDYQPQTDCRDIVIGCEDKPDHPSPKPLTVMRWFLNVLDCATIIDPFCGSGTTLLAAKEQGRQATGIEIEEKYCEIAAKRLSQEVFQF